MNWTQIESKWFEMTRRVRFELTAPSASSAQNTANNSVYEPEVADHVQTSGQPETSVR